MSAPVFARTPSLLNTGNFLDYAKSEDRKHYNKAVQALSEDLFDCTAENLMIFLNDLQRRATEFGWDDEVTGILQIPDDPTDITSPLNNLITNYSEVTKDQIKISDNTYIDQNLRPAQDNAMLYACLMNSLTASAKAEVALHDKTIETKKGFKSGTMLLKVIIQASHIDTNATTQTIRLQLSELDDYMVSIGNDIKKFNLYVSMNMKQLAARGESTDDLLTNLFKGYLAAKDKRFVKYIEKKQSLYEEGQYMTSKQLMDWAKTKYDILVQKKLWEAPSSKEEKLIALQTEVTELKKANKRNGKKNSNSNKKGNRRQPQKYGLKKPDWFYEEPTGKALWYPREWNGKKWFWCGKATKGNCECYRMHKGKDCDPDHVPEFVRNRKNSNNNNNNKSKDTETHEENKSSSSRTSRKTKVRFATNITKDKSKKVKLAQAYGAVIEQDEDELSTSSG